MKRLLIVLFILAFSAPGYARVSGSRTHFGTAGLTIDNTGCVNIKNAGGTAIGVLCLDASDDLNIGDATGVDNITLDSAGIVSLLDPLFIKEQAAASANVAGYGQIYIKTATPNTLQFVDDAGNEIELGAAGSTTLVNDLTPQLGGNLDMNSHHIQSTGETDIIGPAAANNIVEIQATTGNSSYLRMAGDDISQGVTSVLPADVYFGISPIAATTGGTLLTGTRAGAAEAFEIDAISDSTSPNAAIGLLQLVSKKSDGATGVTALAATERVLSVKNNTTEVLTIYGSGAQAIVSTATTQNAMKITANSLTTGLGLSITSNSTDTSTREILYLVNDNAAATGARVAFFQQDSTKPNTTLDSNGDAVSLSIDSEATTKPAIKIDVVAAADIGFINFVGTAAANATNAISTWTTGNSIQGFVQQQVNGSSVWFAYYDDPTS